MVIGEVSAGRLLTFTAGLPRRGYAPDPFYAIR